MKDPEIKNKLLTNIANKYGDDHLKRVLSTGRKVQLKNSYDKLDKEMKLFNCNLLSINNFEATFYCNYCKLLTSLEGAPKKVSGDFICSNCDSLTSLKGAPEKVSGDFYCNYNSLTSLEGAPIEIGGDFRCKAGCKEFYEEDVKKVSNVQGVIYV